YSRAEITAALERDVPPDKIIAGESTPWAFAGLKRRTVFTNCGFPKIDFANPIDTLPIRPDFYFSEKKPGSDPCAPADIDAYTVIDYYSMFTPANLGGWKGTEEHWEIRVPMCLYKRAR